MENQIKYTEQLEKFNGYYITKQKDIIHIKKELHDMNDGICPILKKKYPLDKMVIDHKHKKKSDIPTIENRLGMIRGVLEFRANSFEGKVWNFYKRLGLDKEIGFSELLRNLADYHDNPCCTDHILHYKEVPKRKKVKTSEWNKIKKYYLMCYPHKRSIPKKPTYVNDQFIEIKRDIDKFEEDLKNGKIPTINKIEFKRILKYYNIIYPRRTKLPTYPKYGIMDNEMKELLEKVNRIHFNKEINNFNQQK